MRTSGSSRRRSTLGAVVWLASPILFNACAGDTNDETVGESRAALSTRESPTGETVDDAPVQFASLALRPDGLAFDVGNSPDPTQYKHYQGLARVNGPDGTPYLFVSRSGTCPSLPGGIPYCGDDTPNDDPGNLLVVKLGSRGTDGERLRSNRLRVGSPINSTPPDPRDRVVRTITFNGTTWPAYTHPGGMQVIGDVLVLAVEDPWADGLPEDLFMFIDVGDPENPELLSTWAPPGPKGRFKAGLVGITPLRTPGGDCCNYALVATGDKNEELRFFRSIPSADGTTNLYANDLEWEETGRFPEFWIEACLNSNKPPWLPDIFEIDWHTGSGDGHQTLNFVREGSVGGPLYMVGLRNTTLLPSGHDMMDLYRIHLNAEGAPEPCFIEFAGEKHVTSYPFMGGGDSANFAAAGGVYVSPSRELIIYGAEYENDGPAGSVRFAEYRHRDMVRPDSPSLRPTVQVASEWQVDEGGTVTLSGTGEAARSKAWIQLFEDDGAGASLPGVLDSDQWLAVDYPDRYQDDFEHFPALSFNDNAGSWRWFAPPGCTIRAYEHSYGGGSFVSLTGRGVETDLDDIDFDDKVSSVRFQPDCDAYYDATMGLRWDLDGSGFSTSGQSVVFDASTLDGPSSRTISVRAQHPTDSSGYGVSDPSEAQVTILNVAPSIDVVTIENDLDAELGTDVPVQLVGLPLHLSATFTDPGIHDSQTARLSWGDGTVDTTFESFIDTLGGVTGSLEQTHVFTSTGTFHVELTITDDDGASTVTSTSVEIVDASAAIEVMADVLAQMLQEEGPQVAQALQEAIDALIGNQAGAADNGALDSLPDDPGSALTHLVTVSGYLDLASSLGGSDITTVQGLLGLIAENIARTAADEAERAISPPTNGQRKQLERINRLIADGHELVLDGRVTEAIGLFRRAVTIAMDLIAGA